MTEIERKGYFDSLANSAVEEFRKVGWGSRESMYSKLYTALSLIPLKEEGRVLDIGCGTGALEELLIAKYPSWEIHAIDISEAQLKHAKQKGLPVN